MDDDDFIFDTKRVRGRPIALCCSLSKGFLTAYSDERGVESVFIDFATEFDDSFPQWRVELTKAANQAAKMALDRMDAQIAAVMEMKRKRWTK